jgi:hypothetical protein
VPAVGEPGVGVVDALVGRPKLLALLERHVPAVMVLLRAHDDAGWPRDIVLWPRRWRKLAQERRWWRLGKPTAAAHGAARRSFSVVLRILHLGRHLHGAGCRGSYGGPCESDDRACQLIRLGQPPPAQGLEPSPSMPAQKLRRWA